MNINQIQDRQNLIRSLKNDNKMTFTAIGKRLKMSSSNAFYVYWQDIEYLKERNQPRRIFITVDGKAITLLTRY